MAYLLDKHVKVLGKLGSEAYYDEDHTVSLDQQRHMHGSSAWASGEARAGIFYLYIIV